MSEHAQLIRVLTVEVAPGKRDEAVHLVEELAEKIRHVEGCFGMQVCSVREEPEWIAVVSRWESQAAYDRGLAIIEGSGERARGLVQGAPRAYTMTPV